MSEMNIGVIQFPGANCERETHMALRRNGLKGVDVFWNQPNLDLNQFSGFVIIGGFSYEDRGRAGLIAAKDPLLKKLRAVAAQGKPILGICNGAQILVESGLVPGIDGASQSIALTQNKRLKDGKVVGTGYYNDWTYVKPKAYNKNSCFMNTAIKQLIHIPIAHAEGRFVMTKTLFALLNDHGATFWQYTDNKGCVIDEFPTNPNGSLANIAGVSNLNGNVLALMPHPERTPNGDVFFSAMRQYIEAGCPLPSPKDISFSNKQITKLKHFTSQKEQIRLIIATKLTDDTALSMQTLFHNEGLNLKLKRYRFVEISVKGMDKAELLAKLEKTGELYNPNKEMLVNISEDNKKHYLVRPQDDIEGLQLAQKLRDYYAFPEHLALTTGTLWQINDAKLIKEHEQAMILPLLYHQQSECCYAY